MRRQIPFLTFFGATAIGKAIVKTHLQTFFVVLLLSESALETIVDKAVHIPVIGQRMHDFILAKQEQTRLQFMSEQAGEGLEPQVRTAAPAPALTCARPTGQAWGWAHSSP